MSNNDYRRRAFRFSDSFDSMDSAHVTHRQRKRHRHVRMRNRKPKRQNSRFQYGKKLPVRTRTQSTCLWCRKEV